jgi:hypothetical protein
MSRGGRPRRPPSFALNLSRTAVELPVPSSASTVLADRGTLAAAWKRLAPLPLVVARKPVPLQTWSRRRGSSPAYCPSRSVGAVAIIAVEFLSGPGLFR